MELTARACFASMFAVAAMSGLPATGAELAIPLIQGADHKTTISSTDEVTTSGIVTAQFGPGFFMQSLEPHSDPATSEGLYVYLGEQSVFPLPARGEIVKVTGRVGEFQPLLEPPLFTTREQAVCGTTQINTVSNTDRGNFLTGTQIQRVTAMVGAGNGSLPKPVPFAPPGMNSDLGYADKPQTPFNPAAHPRDYFESLEGMRVVIKNAIVVSRKDRGWDQFWVVPAAGLDTSELTAYGLPLTKAGHVFPEIVQVHKALGQSAFALPVGTRVGDLTGVVTYENGNYMVLLDTIIDERAYPAPAAPSITPPTLTEGMRIATYNAENLSAAGEGAAARFAAIAGQIVEQLGSPDIIALQEVQDDDGEGASAVVTAATTIQTLIEAIASAGGRAYEAVSYDPTLPNTDGGAPGANIRTVFLVATDSTVNVLASERLFDGNDRCDAATNPFQSSRRPLLMEAEIDGVRFAFVNLHLSSKLGDQGLYSNAEDPQPGSSERRRRQAAALVAELERRYGDSPPVIVLMGDFNDHSDAAALQPFHDSALGFEFLTDDRGANYTASYSFNGVREAIDHFVVGGAGLAGSHVSYLNLNADELKQVSDHNPVVLVVE